MTRRTKSKPRVVELTDREASMVLSDTENRWEDIVGDDLAYALSDAISDREPADWYSGYSDDEVAAVIRVRR